MANRPGSKGIELEEALKAYFWQAGYFVVRGLPFRVDGEDVTDVDLWLYERPAASTRRRLIVDIKNKRTPRAAERIIWTRGLYSALGVDGAIVATTDMRPGTRKLGKALNVIVLDGDAVNKLTKSTRLQNTGEIRSEEFDAAVKRVDEGRRSSDWRQNLNEARASVLQGFGVQSANTTLRAIGYFSSQVLEAQPQSDQACVALRLVYLSASLAAVSLDFVLADQAFRSTEERMRSIIGAIRFGQSDISETVPTVRAAIGLARQYAENGNAIAKQIEHGFFRAAERIPAEMIAEYLSRSSTSEALFNTARELQRASSLERLIPFDELTIEARSLLGVFFDFNHIPRDKVARAWLPSKLQPRLPYGDTVENTDENASKDDHGPQPFTDEKFE
jgi:hypothetical protein